MSHPGLKLLPFEEAHAQQSHRKLLPTTTT